FIHTCWWTPHGQICDAQQLLHISNTTEHDAGLYVCISGYHEEHMSIFNLHVRKRSHDKRLRREVQIGLVELNAEDNDNTLRNGPAVRAVQQSQFVLAVCLSVFITFIVAFVLGVILRPVLEKCYKQIRNKRESSTSASNSQSSSTRQRPYVNEGYSDTDDQEQEVHTGPRVTFGQVTEIQEQGGVPYYVTVDDSPSGSNTDVAVLYENVEKIGSLTETIDVHKEVPLREQNKEMTRYRSTESLNSEGSKGMQFEYITDQEDTTELGERSIVPASSLTGKWQEPQLSYEARESTEQNVESPTISIYEEEDEQASMDNQATIPRLMTDPFPLKMSESKEESVDELDPDLWNDSGESFSFTDGSPRSSSRVSDVAALGSPTIQEEMSVDEPSERPNSCNSSESGESEGGPTEYTVNPVVGEDLEEHMSYTEDDDDSNYGKKRPFEEYVLTEEQTADMGVLLRQDTITLDPTDIHMTYTRGDSFDEEAFTEYKESLNTSNVSSDYEDEPTQYHVHPVYRTSQKSTNLISEDSSRTYSCSEEDHEQGDYPRKLEIRLEHRNPSIDATPVISQDRVLNINYDNSSSSTDIEVKRNKENERGIFKGLSGLSARLFNRSGFETNKDVQLEPNTVTTSRK
ncbi:leucine-rich repeat-containing protein 66, partial [Clarias magur]